MTHFSLQPNKIDWDEKKSFLDSQDLNDCCEYPDDKFIPWLYHFNLFNTQVYIKRSRKYYKIICYNFNSRIVKLQPCSGYLSASFETFSEALTHFYYIVKEIINGLGVFDYGVPF